MIDRARLARARLAPGILQLRAPELRALHLLLLGSLLLGPLLLIGCASPEATRRDPELPRPPGVAQVRQASARLHTLLRAGLAGRWPARLKRSRDFPELPLVRRPPLRDLGAWAADRSDLEAALDAELRREKELRLELDEAAVPAWLREDEPQDADSAEGAPQPPLTLESWLSSSGKIGLRLKESNGDVLAQSESDALSR